MSGHDSLKHSDRSAKFRPWIMSGCNSQAPFEHSASFRPRSMAERSNLWRITALIYEPLWRRWSTLLLTKGRWSIDHELQRLVALVAPQPGGAYLDVGCSTGLYARTLAAALPNIKVTLVDYSEPMLRQACKRLGLAGFDSATFVLADAARLPFGDCTFQGVVCGGTLNELTEPEAVICETARVLMPGGRCVVMHLCRQKERGGFSSFVARGVRMLLRIGGVSLPEASWVDRLFQNAGLQQVGEESAGWMRMVLLKKLAD